ncbi:hypothetical protein JHK87_050037 [Glycine soja]|nr:hypothetical protein JHK87_050037 [Glycine soja]
MQLRFQLQGRSSVTKGKQGRVKETEGVLNGAIYSHCHGFFSVQKILSSNEFRVQSMLFLTLTGSLNDI